MFDVGGAELFVLAVLGLLVLGPERLPAVARTLGGFVRKARLSYTSLKRTVEAELAAAEAANPLQEAQKELESVKRQVAELGGQLDKEITEPSIGGGLENSSEANDSPAEPATETRTLTAPDPEPAPETSSEPADEPTVESKPKAEGSAMKDAEKEPEPASPDPRDKP